MSDTPTIAEVREDLADGLTFARHEGTLFADIADRMESHLARLDPDKVVIVTAESLAAKLHEALIGCCWNETESRYEDPPGWTHAGDAAALMRALRDVPATTVTELPDIGTGYPEPVE